MNELEAARFVRAALELIRDEIPNGTQTMIAVSVCIDRLDGQIRHLEKSAPPWEPERPLLALTWAQVHAGDEVLAPDNQWYKVDSWSRTGDRVAVLIVVNGDKVPDSMPAASAVMVRRGPEGKAVDVFAAAGIELERIGR
jgi:hypothetical protein